MIGVCNHLSIIRKRNLVTWSIEHNLRNRDHRTWRSGFIKNPIPNFQLPHRRPTIRSCNWSVDCQSLSATCRTDKGDAGELRRGHFLHHLDEVRGHAVVPRPDVVAGVVQLAVLLGRLRDGQAFGWSDRLGRGKEDLFECLVTHQIRSSSSSSSSPLPSASRSPNWLSVLPRLANWMSHW